MSGYTDLLRDTTAGEMKTNAVSLDDMLRVAREIEASTQSLEDWAGERALVYDQQGALIGMANHVEGWLTLVDDHPAYRGLETIIVGDRPYRLVRLDPESPQMRAYHARHKRE